MIEIRKAELTDLSILQQLSQELFLFEKQFSDEFNEAWPFGYSGKEYLVKKIIGENNSLALLVFVDGKAIGYLLGQLNSPDMRKQVPVADLENIYIQEAYRGQGIGKQLMQEYINWAKGKYAKRFKLFCYASNLSALEFYREFGFKDFAVWMEGTL